MLFYDSLRFVAAAGIMFHHSNSFLYPAATRIASKEYSFGMALLVDLFFLISGYVIAFVYGSRIRTGTQYRIFLQKRFARLFPLHFLTLVVSAALYYLAMVTGHTVGSMPDLSATCLAKTALMVHAIFQCDGAVVNPVSWSISAEMAMYVIFPLLFLVLARNRTSAAVAMVLAIAAIAFLCWSKTAHEWTAVYAPLRALPSFCFGLCLFRVLAETPKPNPSWRLPTVSVLWIAVLAMFYLMMNGAPAIYVLATIYFVCTLAAYLDLQVSSSSILRAAAGLGRLTYSIYMIHLLVVTALINVVAEKILKLPYGPMIIVIFLSSLVVLVLSLATYFWIEMPLRRTLSPRPAAISGATVKASN